MTLAIGPHYVDEAPALGNLAGLPATLDVEAYLFCFLVVASDGNIYQQGPLDNVTFGTPTWTVLMPWLVPAVGMNLYECRATPTGIRFPEGNALGEWLSLDQSVGWGFNITPRDSKRAEFTVVPDKSATFTLEIRLKSDPGTILATVTVTTLAVGNA